MVKKKQYLEQTINNKTVMKWMKKLLTTWEKI